VVVVVAVMVVKAVEAKPYPSPFVIPILNLRMT